MLSSRTHSTALQRTWPDDLKNREQTEKNYQHVLGNLASQSHVLLLIFDITVEIGVVVSYIYIYLLSLVSMKNLCLSKLQPRPSQLARNRNLFFTSGEGFVHNFIYYSKALPSHLCVVVPLYLDHLKF